MRLTCACSYVDSGHGHDEGLSEIELENKAGNFVDSKTASIADAATQAVNQNLFPQDGTASFADVKLLDLDGDNTWPIVAVTYLYVLPGPCREVVVLTMATGTLIRIRRLWESWGGCWKLS